MSRNTKNNVVEVMKSKEVQEARSGILCAYCGSKRYQAENDFKPCDICKENFTEDKNGKYKPIYE